MSSEKPGDRLLKAFVEATEEFLADATYCGIITQTDADHIKMLFSAYRQNPKGVAARKAGTRAYTSVVNLLKVCEELDNREGNPKLHEKIQALYRIIENE